MMLRGLGKLTWLEIKIFLREPMGVFGTVLIPVALFVLLTRMIGSRATPSEDALTFARVRLPVLVIMFILLGAVTSLVAVISIYREGGILKRLRATPLRPTTILVAHVIVKLILSLVTFGLLALVGRRVYLFDLTVHPVSFMLALLLCLASIVSIGFIIASAVPTARFAQPLASAVLYPMLALSGLFVPISRLPDLWQKIAQSLPLTHAAQLMQGIWTGDPWGAHFANVIALCVFFVVFTVIAARFFRWE